MDGNQNGTVNIETKYCAQCGSLNYKSSTYCTKCGAALNQGSTEHKPMQQQPQEEFVNGNPYQRFPEQDKNKPLMIGLAVVSIILALLDQRLSVIIFICALVAYFFPKTKLYGKIVLRAYLIGFIIGVILIVVLFGMCLGSFN